jgi:hypothetical protein
MMAGAAKKQYFVISKYYITYKSLLFVGPLQVFQLCPATFIASVSMYNYYILTIKSIVLRLPCIMSWITDFFLCVHLVSLDVIIGTRKFRRTRNDHRAQMSQ